jgi:predicted transcriptional regulator
MTDLLEHAVATARTLPPEMQDDIARIMLLFAGEPQSIVQLTPEEDAALARSEAEAARGEFATDEEIEAIWAKYGR